MIYDMKMIISAWEKSYHVFVSIFMSMLILDFLSIYVYIEIEVAGSSSSSSVP